MCRRCHAVIDACGRPTRYEASFNNKLKTMRKFHLLESPVLRQILGRPDVCCSHAWMRWHFTLKIKESLKDIFSIIMY